MQIHLADSQKRKISSKTPMKCQNYICKIYYLKFGHCLNIEILSEKNFSKQDPRFLVEIFVFYAKLEN